MIAKGIDEATWLFPLRQGDYSRWHQESIEETGLAEQAEAIEKEQKPSPFGKSFADQGSYCGTQHSGGGLSC